MAYEREERIHRNSNSEAYDFKQEVYCLIGMYMEALSPTQIATALREIANEESAREN